MSPKDFSDVPNPEKEDAVREALGVEKKFVVNLRITTIGQIETSGMIIMAINKDEAEKKAKELWFNGGYDAEGNEPEEANHEYDCDDDINTCQAKVEEA